MIESIKFTHSPNGCLGYKTTNPLNFLPTIFAIAKTQTEDGELATDRAGMKGAVSMAQQALDLLHLSISALGVMFAYVEHREVEEQMTSFGWLLSGLSELALEVDCAREKIQEALDKKEAAQSAPQPKT